MKMEEILKLIEAVSASELTDFKYEENGTKLNLKKEQQKVEIIQSPGVVPVTGTVTAGLQTAEILQNPGNEADHTQDCLLYTSPSPRDYAASRMPSSA